MNNLFKKISGLALGLALTLGAGISAFTVGNGAVKADAATEVTVSIKDYATSNSWANGTKYPTIAIDSNITAEAVGGENTGKYYTSGNEWRIYQTENPTLTIKASTGYKLDSVTVSYSLKNGGTLTYGGNNIASKAAVTVDASEIVFNVGNTGSATKGQVKVTAITVSYSEGTGTGGSGTTPTPDPEEPEIPEEPSESESGSLEKPYTVTEAYAIASQLADGKNTTEQIYVKGFVVAGKDSYSKDTPNVYNGRATFHLTDGTSTIMAYNMNDTNNKATYTTNPVTVGNEVVVTGCFKNYKGFYQVCYVSNVANAQIISISEGQAPKDPTIEISYSTKILGVGEKTTLTATAKNAPEEYTISWTSSDATIATVSDGIVTALAEGKVTITGNLVSGGKTVATASVELTIYTPFNDKEGHYELVTEEKQDWTGTYLLAATLEEQIYIFNGVDANNGFASGTLEGNVLTPNAGYTPVQIEETDAGYSLQVLNGQNYGKYISGKSGDNKLNFTTDIKDNEIVFLENGTVEIVSDTSILTFNSDAKYLRFRYYKETTANGDLETYLRLNLYEYKENTEEPELSALDRFVKVFLHMDDIATSNQADTGACRGDNGYYAKAKAAYAELTSADKETFWTETTYANARERLSAWARANGDTIDMTDYSIKAANSGLGILNIVNNSSNSYVLIIIAGLIAASALVAYLVINNKRKNSK